MRKSLIHFIKGMMQNHSGAYSAPRSSCGPLPPWSWGSLSLCSPPRAIAGELKPPRCSCDRALPTAFDKPPPLRFRHVV